MLLRRYRNIAKEVITEPVKVAEKATEEVTEVSEKPKRSRSVRKGRVKVGVTNVR